VVKPCYLLIFAACGWESVGPACPGTSGEVGRGEASGSRCWSNLSNLSNQEWKERTGGLCLLPKFINEVRSPPSSNRLRFCSQWSDRLTW
jgi:hypothetical protein